MISKKIIITKFFAMAFLTAFATTASAVQEELGIFLGVKTMDAKGWDNNVAFLGGEYSEQAEIGFNAVFNGESWPLAGFISLSASGANDSATDNGVTFTRSASSQDLLFGARVYLLNSFVRLYVEGSGGFSRGAMDYEFRNNAGDRDSQTIEGIVPVWGYGAGLDLVISKKYVFGFAARFTEADDVTLKYKDTEVTDVNTGGVQYFGYFAYRSE